MRYASVLYMTLMITAAMAWAAPDAGPTMDEIIGHYQKIQLSLAADSLNGVRAEAQAITQKADALLKQQTTLKGKNAVEFRKLLEDIRGGAQRVDDSDLKKARAGFGQLSQPIVRYVKDFQGGKDRYYVAHCPMAKQSWVQTEKAIKNPFYGKSMLSCGTIVPNR